MIFNTGLIEYEILIQIGKNLHIEKFKEATIREVVSLTEALENELGIKYIHMEIGSPGIPVPLPASEAILNAVKSGLSSKYPMLSGYKPLKEEASRFVEAFMGIKLNPECFIPVAGSVQGSFGTFLLAKECYPKRRKVLLIDPGFPVHRAQLVNLNIGIDSFDLKYFRGRNLYYKLEEMLSSGDYFCLLYSNPNNPTWMCLSETELEIIAEICQKFDVLPVEDLAYFGMDFRKDISTPFAPPYQSTVARYTNNYIILLSSSKIFSMAGERVGLTIISPDLFERKYGNLTLKYNTPNFGTTFISRIMYVLGAGVNHTAQAGLAAILKVCTDGQFNYIERLQVYGQKSAKLKSLFTKYGFNIPYNFDDSTELSDGFYFTLTYPGLNSEELLTRLLMCGISAISLYHSGSKIEGIRACSSAISESEFEILEKRLKLFVNF